MNNWTAVYKTSYRLNYKYEGIQPHAPSTIIDEPNLVPTTTCCDPNNPEVNFANYGYDKKGNPLNIEKNTCSVAEDDRAFMWDEENRLRFVDTSPSTPEVDGSAIYTYDAGGERIIKQLLSSEIIDFKNGVTKTVDSANSITATIYPNGLISARLQYEPGDDYNGTYIIDYTKHYFAGTQRITGKLGEGSNFGAFNCSWLIIPFGNGGAPINEKDKALAALTTANAAVLALMQSKGITPPPGFGQNAGYTGNCVSSYAGPEENHVYWYHPDHLGSSSFITGIDGEVNQNIEYFPSGEVFLENHLNSYNTPYKFNSKELDDETGYYYYGARYYNPRVSLWLNVDPLASYDPIMNGEHYMDGEHNGGVYNSGNLNPYIYTYNSPIIFTDPNGKQSFADALFGFIAPPRRANTPLTQMQQNGNLTKFMAGSAGAAYLTVPVAFTSSFWGPYAGLLGRGMIFSSMYQSISTTQQAYNAKSKVEAQKLLNLAGEQSKVAVVGALFEGAGLIFASTAQKLYVALGKNINLEEFAKKTGSSSFHTWDSTVSGFGSQNFYNFQSAFNYVTNQILKTGGKLFFNLESVNIQAAGQIPKGTGLYQQLPSLGGKSYWEMNMTTEWELSQILNNKTLLNNTKFYKMGIQVPTKTVINAAK